MKVFRKITMYCVKEIDDNLEPDEQQEAIDEFETDMAMDADNFGVGGAENYEACSSTVSEMTEEEKDDMTERM